jgi:DNA-binding HxlR family transcriptional regulator
MAKKWAVEVIYSLADGPQRYNALLKGLDDNVTPKVFTRVLRRLEADNIIERHVLDQSPPMVVYEITDFGSSLVQTLDDMAQLWEGRHVRGSA